MNYRTGMFIGSVGLLASACASTSVADLDRRIAQRKDEIQDLTGQIVAVAPQPFKPTHEVHAELRYRPLEAWLARVTTPAFVISADGVRSSGDVVYKPGIGKAWIEPAQDSKVRLSISKFALVAQPGVLNWRATALANAEVRLRLHVLGVGSNVLCKGSLPPAQPGGSFAIGQAAEMKLPYLMRFSVPGELNVKVTCGLGQLGSVNFSFPIGSIAETVSQGSIGLGLETSTLVQLPAEAGGKVYVFRLATKDPAIGMSKESLVFNANINVVVEQP